MIRNRSLRLYTITQFMEQNEVVSGEQIDQV